MNIPAASLVFFSFVLLAALFMIAEGSLILFLRKRFTPLPTRVLIRLNRIAARRRMTDPVTSKQLCTYASCDLMFGIMMLISSCVYLFEMI